MLGKWFKGLFKQKHKLLPCKHKWVEGHGYDLGRRYCSVCGQKQALFSELQPRMYWKDIL